MTAADKKGQDTSGRRDAGLCILCGAPATRTGNLPGAAALKSRIHGQHENRWLYDPYCTPCREKVEEKARKRVDAKKRRLATQKRLYLKRKEERAAKGLCIAWKNSNCDNPVELGKMECADCINQWKLKRASLYYKRKENDLCTTCGAPDTGYKTVNGQPVKAATCYKCREKQRKYVAWKKQLERDMVAIVENY